MWNYVCLLDYMLVYLHVAVYSYIVFISIHLIIFSYRSISWSLLSTLIETKGQSLNLLNLPLNVPAALGWNLHLPWAHLHLEVLIQLPDGLWWWWLVVAGGGWWWSGGWLVMKADGKEKNGSKEQNLITVITNYLMQPYY